jgi:hypothetical protein
MSIAWTTFVIIIMLLPGVFFLLGIATTERYSREIVKASAVGEIAIAVVAALVLHLLALAFLRLVGFDVERFLRPLIELHRMSPEVAVHFAVKRLWRALAYVIVTAALGFTFGFSLSRLVKAGPLRHLATHKWPHDIPEGGSVTAYVLTTTADNDRVLMYKGFLHEYYLTPEGRFSYLLLTSCSRYFMHFNELSPKTGEPLAMVGPGRSNQTLARYLMIDGDNVANIVFDTAAGLEPGVSADDVDNELREALAELGDLPLDESGEETSATEKPKPPATPHADKT